MRVTGIGGGHGLAATLEAALGYADEVDAVVTVADDGGSSGRLTRELGIPPPGDIRNCLVALSSDPDMAALYQHRFASGALTGHTLGNLLIAALAEMRGDFAGAVSAAAKLLRCRGRVHPATTELVDMRALVNGKVIRGQVAVAQTSAPIQAVYLEPPDPAAHPHAVSAICEADQVVLGPGSLFTSLIATLLVPGIKAALREASGTRVLVVNTRVQKGETLGLDVTAHLEAVLGHVGHDCLDAVVVQVPVVEVDGVAYDPTAVAGLGVQVIEADVAAPTGNHDPRRLAEVLRTAVDRR